MNVCGKSLGAGEGDECNEESEDFNFSCDAVNKLQLFLSDLVDACCTGGGI